jgi:hypothetical protein
MKTAPKMHSSTDEIQNGKGAGKASNETPAQE